MAPFGQTAFWSGTLSHGVPSVDTRNTATDCRWLPGVRQRHSGSRHPKRPLRFLHSRHSAWLYHFSPEVELQLSVPSVLLHFPTQRLVAVRGQIDVAASTQPGSVRTVSAVRMPAVSEHKRVTLPFELLSRLLPCFSVPQCRPDSVGVSDSPSLLPRRVFACVSSWVSAPVRYPHSR